MSREEKKEKEGIRPLAYGQEIASELGRILARVDDREAEALVEAILSAPRIFFAGAGRSGLCMRAAAMRLMHLGLETYIVGEIVTPALQPGDLLIICSGSGATASLTAIAGRARKLGGRVALVTIAPGSPIGACADLELHIPAVSPKRAETSGEANGKEGEKGAQVSIQPMASAFEQCLLLTLDILVMKLMRRLGKDAGEMFSRHANLE